MLHLTQYYKNGFGFFDLFYICASTTYRKTNTNEFPLENWVYKCWEEMVSATGRSIWVKLEEYGNVIWTKEEWEDLWPACLDRHTKVSRPQNATQISNSTY